MSGESLRESFERWAQKRGYLFLDEQGGKEWDEDSNILSEAWRAGYAAGAAAMSLQIKNICENSNPTYKTRIDQTLAIIGKGENHGAD